MTRLFRVGLAATMGLAMAAPAGFAQQPAATTAAQDPAASSVVTETRPATTMVLAAARVDLIADSPTRPTTSPGATVSVTPSTARNAGARPRFGVLDGDVAEVDDEHPRRAGDRRRLGRPRRLVDRPPARWTRSRRGAARRAAAPACRGPAARGTPASTSPVSTIRPRCITSTRSDRSATTPMSWVISRMPASMRSRRSRSSLRISACTVTSSAVVGSSAISSFGSIASAWAIIARWRWPPDSWCG